MSKLSTKFAVLFASFVGIALFFSGGKAFAVTCPSPNPPPEWGINTGAAEHGYASLTVHAINGGDANKPLDVKYNLKSTLPTLPAGKNYGPNPGVDPSLWPNARMFKVHVDGSGSIVTDARYKQRWFGTSGLVDKLYPGGNSCTGWDQLGPGSYDRQGNLYVLDCQEVDNEGGKHDTRFWVSDISTPSGEAGRYGGHWEVKFSVDGGASSTITNNITTNPMDPNVSFPKKLYFSVWNGVNARLDLVWHPNTPPPCPPGGCTDNGRCEQLYVNGWGTYDTGSSLPNGAPRYRDTRTYIRVTDGNGNVLVPQSGDAKSDDGQFAILNGGPGPPGYNQDHTWYYKNDLRAGTVNVHIIRKWHHRNGTDYNWYTDAGQDNSNTYNCFNTSCDLSVQGNVSGRPNGVESRSNFSVTANVHNYGTPEGDDPLPAVIGGRPLILSSTSSPVGFWYDPAAPSGLPKGSGDQHTWNVNEPGWNINHYEVHAKLYYDFDPSPGIQGGDLVLADCSPTSYDVYKQFDLKPTSAVDLTPDAEEPTNVRYTARADATSLNYIPAELGQIQVSYNANAKRKLYGGADETLNSQSGTATTPVLYQWNFDPRPDHAGDKYYLDPFCISQAHGWVGPGGNQFSDDTYGECADESHAYIYDRPYVHAYGSDVISDSNFKDGDTCNGVASPQGISAFRSTAKEGSGAQFAAMALSQISGFGSSSIRSGWPHRLSISNTTGTSGSLGTSQPKDGGFYTGQAVCAPDFYSTLKSNPTTVSSSFIGINSLADGKQNYRNGNLTISGGTFDKQATLFVNGNVYIRGSDITYPAGKYLAIFAKGDIYIDKNIQNLNGVYVAQPNGGSGGTIYTCSQVGINSATLYGADDLYDQCRKQLVVTGAFVAKKVDFKRVIHSLRDSCRNEYVSALGGCGASNAAEVFNLTPDFYLYTPVYDDVTTGQPYQYITTLPPVL
jgi:hypothetical protein